VLCVLLPVDPELKTDDFCWLKKWNVMFTISAMNPISNIHVY
jgi:hypothetical protein